MKEVTEEEGVEFVWAQEVRGFGWYRRGRASFAVVTIYVIYYKKFRAE